MDSSSMATVWATTLAFIWRPENDGQDADSAPGEGFLTRWGVTQATWDHGVAQGLVTGTLADATKDDLAKVLRVYFWNFLQCDRFCNAGAPGLAMVLVNAAMMTGAGRATRILQGIANTPVDGLLGPKTVAAALAKDHDQMVGKFTDAFLETMRSFAKWSMFGNGWMRRAEAAESLALHVQAQSA